tara:strand:- start:235 stop:357 length:123 start_codon:yes stop_codon:yes gene_type:complete
MSANFALVTALLAIVVVIAVVPVPVTSPDKVIDWLVVKNP